MKQNKPRRSEPGPPGLDAVFGVHAVRALLERGETPKQVWVQEGSAGSRLAELLEAARQGGARITPRPRVELDRLARGAAHQGIVAFTAPLAFGNEAELWFKLEAWPHPSPPLLLVLDGVTDVHNFGACLRSADAAGVHGVIVPKDKSAPLNAMVRKVACGAAESVPVYQVTNLARSLARLKELGVWITGTAGEAESLVFDVDLQGPLAVVMGAEGKGLRRLTREACDTLVKLPMAGSVSSLNVSVATGICLFEAVRQRGSASPGAVSHKL
ncbi:23S rRNA (guanosine(2251)-2'-O)-methyltransferase RlmB [Halomonas urumqiensis]|uniref:23S rRNA (guanosine-2'-O-)-methyltransferase RlmB n=1 Tax=Halomonas urumqiensis TaxID=1684789 RepID=A0A2N7UC11_9GAMM|nr:23S rRNA (guanosine(2251)-2'-O)-methyltransferase RlmB [Halomonas urumqiensis]PMR77974.1 23S rRNA (guanosine(2251)-2'-O)-methyltransferase RlmB [Halomonas urumqiensis]PTB03125.1 23S rRNA (guanosine(2251)-2'-O)-methyltransferase RlmB [Halomonas urumqiensis]GHE20732.1 23S rRNA (guanosine-2'-O-)-methyltransferase RlmB [Halomonas urumqiensis]